uniref:Minor capsid protein P9 transmembrane helices domain-containing protein n=1 Tax=viral metagenome TaxID=1070528 RepID=A0A6C0DCK6_9ZZZZ
MNQNTSSIPTNLYNDFVNPIINGFGTSKNKEPLDNSGNVINDKTDNFSDFNVENNNEKNIEKVPFFTENPNVLFQQKYIFEFFPVDSMTYEQKLNAIARTVILLTLISFAFTQNIRTLLVGVITLGAVFVMYFYHEKERKKVDGKKLTDTKEGFEGPALAYFVDNNIDLPTDVFTRPDSSNPFSNVLVTDYEYNPNKKPAPPSFNTSINSQILTQAKKLVNDANPDQPDLSNKLFKDLGEQLEFEQSLRQFNSNPATTIPNDQGAFAEFCYGSMISCKEGNKFACARNLSRHTLY